MSKRLTGQEMEEMLTWLEYQDELSGLVAKLVSSEKAAWEEVERLKGLLQDALKTMISVRDELKINEKMGRFKCTRCDYTNDINLLSYTIQRIQGESEKNE